ncbi:aldo/keto reductase [Frankia sp. CiP1_Cm_nod2]|uniref:aldo/keto reductase n=1 Tax=Frankia sp. CiP1_Cm_nod2 TaxID=2897161 RepID=UPI002024BC99
MRGTNPGTILGLYRSDHRRQVLEHALTAGIRSLDTSYNYQGFNSHHILSSTAGDLLPMFSVSTKVGFFREVGRVAHSLAPDRLRRAVEESVFDLGRTPDVVFLHNPEKSLVRVDPTHARDRLDAACTALNEAVAAGLCASWGISSWDTRPLIQVLDDDPFAKAPTPDVLMIRVGLTVSSDQLDASERTAERLGVPPDRLWGMSPFGGDAARDVWKRIKAATFLCPDEHGSNMQAVFRASYELPRVTRISVSSSNIDHMRELVSAETLKVDPDQIARYRQLLREKMSHS